MAGGVENRIYERGDDGNPGDFGNAFRAFVGIHRRQHLDLEITQWQVRPAGNDILPEIPFAVAGAVFIERQLFQERIADPHREGALGLTDPPEIAALWLDYVLELAEEARADTSREASTVVIGIHPFVVGTPDGAAAMRRVLMRLKSDPGVWLSDTAAILKAADGK